MNKKDFSNIIGYTEEKNELINLCTLIKKRDELKKIGGKLPHGIYLKGPNGTGKTALAKAFINESKCECVSVDYHDLENDDQFIHYIKEKFNEAASKAPCILFIDELDKLIGGSDFFFMSDNFDKSKIILNEINKYSDVEGLFLLFVSNTNYIIDQSIFRSGRIDKMVKIHLPDENERKEIMEYYLKDKSIDKNVKLDRFAKITNGCSGADIESLVNNSVIKAFVDHRNTITCDDITSAYYEMIFNCKGKDSNLEQESQRQLCFHEAGHSAISLLYQPDSLSFVTILSRNEIKGFAHKVESDDKIKTISSQKEKLVIAFGGLAAEEVFFNERTTGSTADLTNAKSLAMELVRQHGVCGFDKIDEPFAKERKPRLSNDFLEKRERAESDLLNEAYNTAVQMINKNKDLVINIANALLKHKSLSEEMIQQIYEQYINSQNRVQLVNTINRC